MHQTAYIILFMIFLLPSAFSQDKNEFKSTFLEGEYFMMIEEYSEALHYYEELLKLDPENANLHFLTGACYLSLYGQKHIAIPHLEKAVLSISTGYREGSYKERGAPREALFALARAYHINNEFDRAIEQYETYKIAMFKKNFADIEYVNNQIKSCELAKGMVQRPVSVEILNMGDDINRYAANYNPVVSMNDSVIVYMTDKPLYRAIMISMLGEGGWSEPREINEEIGSEGNSYPTCLSFNGRDLYLVKKTYYESDIFVSRLQDGKWSVMEMLNPNINTQYYESHASISLDGRKLLFTSDRPGGQGALDIWMSERSGGGDWGPAVNLGPKVNSFYNEETPFFTESELKIFFSSQGHATMGGFDIFVSEKLPDATWSFPRNLGYPISSSDDDMFYVPRRNGMRGYYSTIHDSMSTGRNIYALIFTPFEDVQIGVRQKKDQPDSEPAGESTTATTKTGTGEMPRDTAEMITPVTLQDSTGEGTLIPGPAGPDSYFVLNSLLFDFDSDRLTDEAMEEADRVFEVLTEHPDLELQLTGHTDAVGDDAYNRQLSYKRANAVAGYLTGRGIETTRLHVTGVGESSPIAINMYEDGTDCPDGRRLNRHVSLKLRNLQDEHIEVAEIFVPEHLQPRSEKRYTVLLIESEYMLDTIPVEVSGEQSALIITDESFLYTAGHFNLKPDAMRYLNEVIDNGYPDASMMERKELERLIADLSQGDMTLEAGFTIQIMALKNPVDVSFFAPLKVTKYSGKDGFHRYIHGDYKGIDEALKELPSYREMGYHDAFIMSVLRYSKTSE